MGCGTMALELKSQGFTVSESTIGRLLQQLDRDGYTQKRGYRGRIITPKGLAYLKQLKKENMSIQYGNELLNKIRITDEQELVNVLVARRAIERETVRMAALWITPGELQELKTIADTSWEEVKEGYQKEEADIRFHCIVAQASKNPILESAFNLISHEGMYNRILSRIRQKVGSSIIKDHYRILEAIEEGDPDKAEEAMVHHLENVIQDVRRYWQEKEEGEN